MIEGLPRVPDWPSKLYEYVETNRRHSFEWGHHDCALFAANWVKVATNVDPAKSYRRRYKTAIGAARVLRNDGDTLEDAVDRALGRRSVPRAFAQRGDVAIVDGYLGPTCGIVIDTGRIAAPGEDGLAFFDMSQVLKVWRV